MTDIPPPPPDIPALIRQCAPHVAEKTMRSLISVESAQRPHAIGYKVVKNGAHYRLSRQPANTTEAKQWARWLLANGYRFDAGIAQVNTVNFASTGLTPETMFDACTSIKAGAQILTQCYQRARTRFSSEQDALRAALSCYQSGNFRTGFRTGYVAKVLRAAGTKGGTAASIKAAPKAAATVSEVKSIHATTSEVAGFAPAKTTGAVATGAFEAVAESGDLK